MKIELNNEFLSPETGFSGYRIIILRPEGKWASIFNGFWRGLNIFAHKTKLWKNTVSFFSIFTSFVHKFVRGGSKFQSKKKILPLPTFCNFWWNEVKITKKPTVFLHSLVLRAKYFKPRQNPLKIDVHLISGRKIIINGCTMKTF